MGTASVVAIVDDAPGLSASRRVTVGRIGWYPADAAALYDRSLYMMDRADAAARLEDPRQSLRHAVAAIEAAPANGYAWTLAAIAGASAGEDRFARTALTRARTLAPNTGRAALQRLLLADIELAGADRAIRTAVHRDLAVARRYEPQALATLRKDSPVLDTALSALEAKSGR